MKKRIISLTLFILIISIITNIYAAISANVSLVVSKDKVKPGETFSVKVNVKDINAGTDGVRGVQLKINYDKNIFETLTADSMKGYSGLTANYNESNKGNILLVIGMGTTGITKDSDFVEVIFKVKENAELKDATVTFENIEVFNTEKLNVGNKTVTVKVTNENNEKGDPTPTPSAKPTSTPNGGSESTPTPSTKPGGTNTNPTPTATAKPNSGENKNDVPVTNIDTNTSNGGSTSNKGNASSGTTIKGSTTSSSSLPKAGIGSTITVLTFVAAIIGIVAYIKLRKYNEI